MNLRTASGAGRPQLWRRRARGERGAAAVACASALPLIVLAVAVAADTVNVARFTTRVERAADAAAGAVSETIARTPNGVDGCTSTNLPNESRRLRVRALRPAGRRRGADGCNNEPRLRRHDDCRLSGSGAKQFRLRARL